MKTLLLLLVLAGAGTVGAQDKAAPRMPTEITLTSGRVLRNVKVLGVKPDALLVKTAAGVETVPFAAVRVPAREVLVALYEESQKPDPVKTRLLAQLREMDRKAVAPAEVAGQVFVVTQGAGAYKFAGVRVWLYPAANFESLESTARMRLPTIRINPSDASAAEAWRKALDGVSPADVATTDAEGKFTLRVPEGKWFVFAEASRRIGRRYEHTVWALPLWPMGDPLLLTQDNEWQP